MNGNNEMKVELLVWTPDPDRIAAIAMRSCHTVEPAHELIVDDEVVIKMVRAAKKVKHYSVLEHASFTFSVGGVSRALTHQLVRHRMASYSQQSQRYVKLTGPTYVVPPGIRDAAGDDEKNVTFPHSLMLFEKTMENAWDCYNMLVEKGVRPEDARFVLPNACTTNIVITMNARELLHFFHLRCNIHTQWEIREMANKMLEKCREKAPVIFEGDPDEWE